MVTEQKNVVGRSDSNNEIRADILRRYNSRPKWHIPSDVIVVTSMPWIVKEDNVENVMYIIPDRSYSTRDQGCLDDYEQNGQYDWTTMGYTSNEGLMAKKTHEEDASTTGTSDNSIVRPAIKVRHKNPFSGEYSSFLIIIIIGYLAIEDCDENPFRRKLQDHPQRGLRL